MRTEVFIAPGAKRVMAPTYEPAGRLGATLTPIWAGVMPPVCEISSQFPPGGVVEAATENATGGPAREMPSIWGCTGPTAFFGYENVKFNGEASRAGMYLPLKGMVPPGDSTWV